MARKKGTKNHRSALEEAETAKLVIEGSKTNAEAAEMLGINPQTVSERLAKFLNTQEIKDTIATSRDRLLRMLSRCDNAYFEALEQDEDLNNRIKVATAIYRTFGLVQDQPQFNQTTIIPIQVVVKDGENERIYTYGPTDSGRKALSASETGEGI